VYKGGGGEELPYKFDWCIRDILGAEAIRVVCWHVPFDAARHYIYLPPPSGRGSSFVDYINNIYIDAGLTWSAAAGLSILTTNNEIKCNTSLGIITREMRVINFLPLPLLLSNRKSPDISNFPPRQFHDPKNNKIKNKNKNGGLSGQGKNVLLLLFLLIYKRLIISSSGRNRIHIPQLGFSI
jgi:hypothetical protein